ncbi:hypothetical protein RQP46_002175 [Phenoliferia psychrophenolica]
MASHATTPTRLKEPYLPAACPYCSVEVEYLATPSADDQLKLACASCEKRFLVNMTTGNTTRLSGRFPPELLSVIIALAAPPSLLNDSYTSLLSFALVSRDWNEATNSILYGTISRKWDSRVAKCLMRTFDERPALLQLFRSFDTYFPDLSNWILSNSQVSHWEDDELQKLRRDAVYTTREAWDAEDGARQRQAETLARERWRIYADEIGAGEWMDPNSYHWPARGPQPKRREGAVAFIDFLSRCPNLRFLNISSMSIGRIGEDEDEALNYAQLDARLPHQIPSLESVSFGSVDDPIIRLILDRAPNLTYVDGGYMSWGVPGTEDVAPLVHLREVLIEQIMQPPLNRGLVLSRTTSALQHLTIGVYSTAVELQLPIILPASPLDTLILIRSSLRGPNDDAAPWSASLSPPLLRYLSSSDILHLFLSCPTTLELLSALPTSLVSLETVWPSAKARYRLGPYAEEVPELDHKGVIRAVTNAMSRLKDLKKFTLRGVAEEQGALDAVVDLAAKNGLKVLLAMSVEKSHYPGAGTEDDPFIVSFAEHDPDNPKEWMAGKKWTYMLIYAVGMMSGTFAVSSYTSGFAGMIEEFGTNPEILAVGQFLFLIGLAIGSLIWPAMGDLLGRKRMAVGTLALFAGLPSSFCFFSAGIQTLGPASLSSLFYPHEIAVPFTVAAIAPFLGPSVGPLIGGFVTQYTGSWRNINWVAVGFAGVMALLACFVPEIFGPTLLRARAERLTRESADGAHFLSQHDVGRKIDIKTEAKVHLIKPFVYLLKEPTVLLFSLYIGFLYAILQIFFTAFPIIYQQNRGWKQGNAGLPFVALILGYFLAVPVTKLCSKPYLTRLSRDGKAAPELRLYFAMIAAASLPPSLFWMAWTATPNVHWINPVLAGGIFGWAQIGITMGIFVYFADVYGTNVGAVFSGMNFLRYGIGGVFPLFVRQLYAKLGVAWACSLIAFLLLGFMPVPFIFYKWGPSIRARSRLVVAKAPVVAVAVANREVDQKQSTDEEEGRASAGTTLTSVV